MINKFNFSICAMLFLMSSGAAAAQIAAGGAFRLEQTVTSSGGGQNAAGGTFALDGTIGQAAAGTRSTASPFSVAGGFWAANSSSPTAASVTIGGRVITPENRGLRNARVTLTEANGATRTALTTTFGYYRFADVAAGETVTVEVFSKKYQFAPQIVNVIEETYNLNFTANP